MTSQQGRADSNSEAKKIENIAEILGLLDEKHKGKDWIFDQIKQSRLKVAAKPTMNNFEILKNCPAVFVTHLLSVLKHEDLDIEDVKSFTKTFHWFFTDIVAGSNPTMATKEQIRKIIALNEIISRIEIFRKRNPDEAVILPTGDGMAIGFSDSPEKPLRLAIEIHKAVNKYNENRRGKDKLLLRIGIDSGPVYVIKDLNNQNNVWGPGIIMTRRVMDLCGDMNIFASERISEDIRKLSPEYKSIFHPIGNYSIKHGEALRIYNVYGDNFGSKLAPRKKKILKKQQTEEEMRGVSPFEFTEIGIGLDVTDPKTMLTHHTWLWKVSNVSDHPKDQIFYYLDGDAPKDFAALNVQVTENGEKLDIVSINVNKPYHKEFNVQLKKTFKPRQRNRVFKLEYDWEEPERNFFYKLASDCKRFSYHFSIPHDIDIKSRILKVDTEMGYKWHAKPAPSVKYGPEKTEVEWEAINLKAYDGYKFEW